MEGLGVVIHLSSDAPCTGALAADLQALTRRLHQHGVATAHLVEGASAAGVAACGAANVRGDAAAAVVAAPPGCAAAALRTALCRLGVSADRVVVLQTFLDDAAPAAGRGPSLAVAAAALGCGVVQLCGGGSRGGEAQEAPPQQPAVVARGLQAVAAHARARWRGAAPLVVVGYALKAAREERLLAAGMLPLLPGADGVCFVPLDVEAEEAAAAAGGGAGAALPAFDVLLHKASDFAEPQEGSGAPPRLRPAAAAALAALERRARAVLNPAAALAPVLDRAAMARAAEAACAAARARGVRCRAPAWAAVQAWGPAAAAAAPPPPAVAKPRAAAGVPEAHQLSLVLAADGLLDDPGVPLPAVVQEYVDHGGALWKVYAAGAAAFASRRRSTPDLRPLAAALAAGAVDAPAALAFDSLASLPTSLPWARRLADGGSAGSSPDRRAGRASSDGGGGGELPPGAAHALAAELRAVLGLELFGFDAAVDAATGEVAVLDVNAFPDYSGIPGAPAALRAAARAALERGAGAAGKGG